MAKYILILLCLCCMAAVGCGRAAGVVFPPPSQQITWPGGDEPARIRYVGQLATSADLKPAQSSLQTISQAIFGKADIESMLTPFAVCTDGANRVFVADSNAQLVHVFDLSTRHYERWKPGDDFPPFSQPVGIAWDPKGRLLVSDSVAGTIVTFDAKGQYKGRIGSSSLKRPCGITVQPGTGRIYVADAVAHQVVVLSPAGEEVMRIGKRGVGPGEFNFPTDVAIDRQGRLYVADALNFRVQQIAPDLKSFRQIGSRGDMAGQFAQPKCIGVDSEDHLYVVDNRFETVQIFDSEGQLLLIFGKEGRGPGEFWLPTGIFIDAKNRIWIADSYNRRVQAFDYLAAAPSTMAAHPENKP